MFLDILEKMPAGYQIFENFEKEKNVSYAELKHDQLHLC